MAIKEWYLGDASKVGFTIQAPGTNNSWGGASHTLRYFTPMQGEAGITIGFEQNPLETLDTDPAAFSKSGRRCSGNFTLPLSYSYHEGILRAALGDIKVTPSGAGPYTHVISLANRVLYANVVYYWENYKGVRFQVSVANVMVTQLTIVQEHGQRPTLAISWVGQVPTASTPGAAPTLIAVEYPDWDEFTFTASGSTTVIDSFTLDIAMPAVEDDYGMASDEDPDPVFIGRSGQRSITLNINGGLDDVIAGIIEAGDGISTNITVWDNSGLTTANRKFSIALGVLLPVVTDQPRGDFSRLKTGMQFICQSTAAAPFSITTTNAIDAEEPPTV